MTDFIKVGVGGGGGGEWHSGLRSFELNGMLPV